MHKQRLLLIDNYDSFTYNLYHLFMQLPGVDVIVRRNDESFLDELEIGSYDAVVIGPGPGSPADPQYFGNCRKVILDYGRKGLPILGVCLGFQGIAYAFGARLKQAALPMHGKRSRLTIAHHGRLFRDIAPSIEVMRYHSLMVSPDEQFPDELMITAEVSEDEPSVSINGRELMAVEHREYPIFGVQFHPESFATEEGLKLAENFVQLVK
jgi:anthranilate synthase component 2